MTESKKDTVQDWIDSDEIPDLSTDEWAKVIDATPVRRGRPISCNPKKSTTIRLDADLLERLKADGKGWQTRVNDILRNAMGL